MHPVVRAAKVAAGPGQVRLRRRLARSLPADPALRIPSDTGYRFFSAEELPGAAEAARRCVALAEGRSERARALNPNKQFLLSVVSGSEFNASPELVRFMISRPVVEAVSEYLGSVPLLGGASLLVSPPNESARSSQLFHIDDEETRQVKLFLNVTETGPEQGPFTFLPADVSERVRRDTGQDRGRMSDERVEAGGGGRSRLRLTGPPGGGLLVDTSRCLHFGSRANRRERLVLLLQFFRFEAPTESKARFRTPPPFAGELDALGRLVLGLR